MNGILQSLDPAQPGSIARAARALSSLLEHLPAPRSIAELRIGHEDIERLWRWAAEMPPAAASWSANQRIVPNLGATRQQAFGLVFLAFAAETARRDASEGRVWEPIRRRLSAAAAVELFVSGQPRQELKDALESACRRWQLRHVFGLEGQQAWYTSVYLQFGFTARTIESRLPARLAHTESVPTAVDHLLHDRRLHSASFASLWDTLIGVRRRNVSERAARAVLSDSGWVLPEWKPLLLKAAVARMDLTPSADDDEDLPLSLFTVPRLEWGEGEPRFTVELVNLADIAGELEPGAYRLCAGAVTAEFAIDALGTPHGLQPLQLPLQPAVMIATVERREGEGSWASVAAEEIRLWDPADEVAAFREDGLRLDAWSTRLHPNQPYILILAPDLEIAPAPEHWIRSNGCLVVHLAAGWPAELSVYLDSAKIWDPLVAAAKHSAPLTGRSLPPSGTHVSEAPTIQLDGLQERVAGVWADRRPIVFQQRGSSVEAVLASHEGVVQPSVRVRTRDINRAARSGRISITWVGAQHLLRSGWASFPVDAIDERDLGQRIRGFAPGWDEPTLFLGNRAIGPTSSRGRAVRVSGARGAALTLRDGRFNSQPDGQMLLADTVSSHGVIQDVDNGGSGLASIILRQAVDLGEVSVIGIDHGGGLEPLQPSATGERSWALDAYPENALAIVFRGELLGAWWQRPLMLPKSDEEAARALTLLRDAAAPLLSTAYDGWVRNALHRQPAGALAWLFNLHLPGSFPADPPLADEFDPAARELLDSWRPDLACTAWLTQALKQLGGEPINTLANTAQRLPVPTARLAAAAFSDESLKQRMQGALLDALGWEAGSSAEILNEIGWQFGVDGGFLERLGREARGREQGQRISALQRQNLLIAMNLSGDFRRWLAGRLIAEA